MRDNGFDIAAAPAAARGVLGLVLTLLCASAGAADVSVRVTDPAGKALENAVAMLRPLAAPAGAATTAAGSRAAMAQRGREFVPGVLSIAAGEQVSFPNYDDTQHHVYSFSPAKVFELPLYKGETPDPVVFDQPGVVALGCNIHDHMRGFIVVADTPYHALTDAAGELSLTDLPPGPYELTIWHARAVAAYHPETVDVVSPSRRLERAVEVSPPPAPVVKGLKAWIAE